MRRDQMLKSAALGAALSVFAVATPRLASAQNLITNPGFEAPTGGTPDQVAGWSLVLDATRQTFQNHTPGGQWMLWAKTFQPVGGGAEQVVDTTPGAEYDLSSFLYFETNYPTSAAVMQLRLTWLNSGGGQVGTPSLLEIQPASVTTTGSWVEYNLNDVVAPVDAEQVRVFLGWAGGTPGAQQIGAFFDDVSLVGPGTAPMSTWSVNESDSWHESDNWANLIVPNAAGAEAQFLGAISSSQLIFANQETTVGTMRFSNANTYVIAGTSSLTIQVNSGSGLIDVAQGAHKINLPLFFASNTNINVAGGAALTIADPTTIRANQTVTKNGNLVIEAPLTLEAGAQLVLGSGLTRMFDAPSTGAGAKVDVKNTTLTIDYRGRATPAATVRAQLTSGYNNGSWNGSGISTSAPLSIAGNATGVGWRDDTANQQIIVKYTYEGDADLNGQVDVADLGALASAWQTAGSWSNGDFDYSGLIDVADLGALASNWQAGVGSPLGPESLAAALAAVGLPGAAVPEPAAAGLLAFAGITLLRRR
jgi:hypothetical protein